MSFCRINILLLFNHNFVHISDLVMGMASHPDRSILYWKSEEDIFLPSFSHVMCGVGLPFARHGMITSLSRTTVNSVCCSSIDGGTEI